MVYEIPKDAKIETIKEDSIVFNDRYYEGLIINTNKGDIKLVIVDSQQCCENFGGLFFDTPDDINSFKGATILSVENIEISVSDIPKNASETQLRIATDKGIIQYAIYNEHNGYYNHGTIVQVFEFQEESSL